ncbi:MAG TPA: hypothetical protein DCY13_18310, partial [Verrucomicrobiales bacterium]|nr:hypothetical protein [Verrucomicrobiales bacterium]
MSHAAMIEMPLPARETAATPPLLNPPSRIRRLARGVASLLDWAFGLVSLVIGLALLSIMPVLNFLSLGYLVHASGRVAATGKLRHGFVGVRKASVLGSFFLGTWLVFLPVRFVSGMWRDAELVAAGSPNARAWYIALLILTVLAVLHVVWAFLRGGRLRHFLWPAPLRFLRWLRTPDKFVTTRNHVVGYLTSLRLPHFFWLGARAFFGAFTWLFVP